MGTLPPREPPADAARPAPGGFVGAALPIVASLTAKVMPQHRMQWLPRCVACLGLVLAGLVVADNALPFAALRGPLLVVLSLPLIYLFWLIDEAASRVELHRNALVDQLTRSEQRCLQAERELAMERASLKDTRDARNLFLVRTPPPPSASHRTHLLLAL